MAIKSIVETTYGETRELYIRLNNVESSNHGVPAEALFRGFVSKEAFEANKGYVWEQMLSFACDVSSPLWPQAYEALKTSEFITAFEDA